MTDLADAHTKETTLIGRKAIITGGTTGIGRAIAVLLASEGVRVFICGRNADHLDDALTRIREVGEGHGIALDLADAEQLARFFSEAKAYLGGIDIAVINAAISAQGLSEMSEAEVRYAIATDFTAGDLMAPANLRQRPSGGASIRDGAVGVGRRASPVRPAASP